MSRSAGHPLFKKPAGKFLLRADFTTELFERQTIWKIVYRKGDNVGPEKKANGLAGARAKSTAKAAAVFLLPALILIVVYMIYPVIDTFVTSAYSWNGISSNKIYIGISNWKTLLSDHSFWSAFGHNVIVMIFPSCFRFPWAFCLPPFWMQEARNSISLRSYGFCLI